MFSKTADSCASMAFAVTPADSDMATPARSLYIGGGGDLRVTTTGGDDVTFSGVPGGTILPVSVARVWSTNTTATSILGLI